MDHSPCNTGTNGNDFAESTSQRLHVDKLRFKLTVPDAESPLHPNIHDKPWRVGRNYAEFKDTEVPGPHGTTIFLQVVDFAGEGPQAWTMEFNPSHFIHGAESSSGVTTSELPDVLAQFRNWIKQRVQVKLNLKLARLQRIDLAADFDLDGLPPAPIIRSLETVRRTNRLKAHSYLGRSDARTLMVEPGLDKPNGGQSWKLRVYGKEALQPGDARLRVELQARSETLKKHELKYLEDLPAWDEAELFRRYWERCRLGTTISAGSELWARLTHRAQASGQKLEEVGDAFGYAYGRDHQDARNTYSGHLRRKHEGFLAAAGCLAVDWSDEVSGHLDLELLRFIRTKD